jgi:hypothetical protein
MHGISSKINEQQPGEKAVHGNVGKEIKEIKIV